VHYDYRYPEATQPATEVQDQRIPRSRGPDIISGEGQSSFTEVSSSPPYASDAYTTRQPEPELEPESESDTGPQQGRVQEYDNKYAKPAHTSHTAHTPYNQYATTELPIAEPEDIYHSQERATDLYTAVHVTETQGSRSTAAYTSSYAAHTSGVENPMQGMSLNRSSVPHTDGM